MVRQPLLSKPPNTPKDEILWITGAISRWVAPGRASHARSHLSDTNDKPHLGPLRTHCSLTP